MAKNVKSKAAAIQKMRERAARELARAEEEEKKLIEPTRKKVGVIAEDVTEEILRENMERIEEVQVDAVALTTALRDAITSIILKNAAPEVSRKPEAVNGDADPRLA